MSRKKVLIHSNYSAAKTGFGKAMRYILTQLYNDEDVELVEAANGVAFGADLKRPWRGYGTMETNPAFLQSLEGNEQRKRANFYGFYCIDKIIEIEKPDVYIGLEDPWAFTDYQKKEWFREIPTVIWTPLDSLPILPFAKILATKTDKFLTWANFAADKMREEGFGNVECLHGPIDFENFKPLENRAAIRARHNIGPENFVIGFVFKNQLRKSVFSLLGAFAEFQKRNENKGRLILHTDWSENEAGTSWNIPEFLKEYNVDPQHVFAPYICKACKNYSLLPYSGENIQCPHCGTSNFVTKTVGFGVDEVQLNEIYNCMDVYCHPFTSGGQEIPLQEAKAAGLITLVNDYSCGSDAAYEEQGGMPLEWVEYKEPHTGFSKAAVSQKSILENLERVYRFSPAARAMYGKWAREYVIENYSFEKIVPRLKKILLEAAEIKKEKLAPNPNYQSDDSLNDHDWIIDTYRNLAGLHVKEGDVEYNHTLSFISKDRGERKKIAGFLRGEILKSSTISFEDLLDKEGKDNRIAVVIPESAGDVLMVNSLLSNLKALYTDDNIYVITKDSFVPMIDDHPAVHKIIPFQDGIDNLLYLEGQWENAGFFKIAFLPHITTQKYFGYHHNGKTKYQFDLK